MEKFLIKLPCKPYTRRWMELTFGDPAELSKDRMLYDIFRSKLRKKSFHYDYTKYNSLKKYTACIDIKITQDLFYRCGWELSRTDVVAFNKHIEQKTKLFMYHLVGLHKFSGHSLSESIDWFQATYGFPESIWQKDSIYRDCGRNLEASTKDIQNDMLTIIKKITNNNFLVKKT